MKIEPEKLIINIIKKEMNLKDDYGVDQEGNLIPCIAIGSQNVLLGTTDQLQIIVRSIYTKTLANRSYELPATSGVTEKKQAIYYDAIQVDMMSYNDDARTRRHELVACLKSIYAKYLCDKYCCQLYYPLLYRYVYSNGHEHKLKTFEVSKERNIECKSMN